MNLIKPFVSLLAMTTLGLALSACGISTLGGGNSGGGGSGGNGGNGGSGACDGPNPADAKCASDADCDAGEICSEDACASSHCECDAATNSWLCTADCTSACVPDNGSGTCDGPNPADARCGGDADCAAGEICSEDACAPSGCECDAATNSWLCTADCTSACVPGGGLCEGPNPQGCFQGPACGEGEICVAEGCTPSVCGCDPESGWYCTDDCGGGLCVPDNYCRDSSVCPNGESCRGPDDVACGIPPQEECFSNGDCGGGNVCHSVSDPCSQDHVGSRCDQPCGGNADCEPGFDCAPGGACTPTPCNDPGGACPSSQLCDPATIDLAAPAPDRTGGCARIPCQDDNVCVNGGVCVNAYCQQGFGECSLPVP